MINDDKNRFRVGVGAIIADGEGKILVGKRGPKARDAHFQWEFFGGLVNFGETPEDALHRLVTEEIGLKIDRLRPIATNVEYKDLEDRQEEWVGLQYEARIKKGQPQRTKADRVIDHKWVTLDEAAKLNLTVTTKIQLDQYVEWLK